MVKKRKGKRDVIRIIANTKEQARKMIRTRPYGKGIALSTLRKIGETDYGNVYVARKKKNFRTHRHRDNKNTKNRR